MLQTLTKNVACQTRPDSFDETKLERPFARAVKRGFDIVAASCTLVILSPLFAVVAVLVRSDGGPAFYKHRRVGKNGRLFDCYKFRSMSSEAEAMLAYHLDQNPSAAAEWAEYQKLKDDIRVTTFGRFLRRYSLDELPQLINVIKGDMSFVGPRPCTPDQANFYDADFAYYRAVRPGITGPWQVGGRNKLTFLQRVALESAYVRNWNLWADIVILLKTVPTIFKKDQAF